MVPETRRKPLNYKIIRSNIEEAIEELQKLGNRLGDGALVEEELQIGLGHAYHHLNVAWNVRRVSTRAYANMTQELFQQWRAYPKDIEDR
jgi:hypothetical protein